MTDHEQTKTDGNVTAIRVHIKKLCVESGYTPIKLPEADPEPGDTPIMVAFRVVESVGSLLTAMPQISEDARVSPEDAEIFNRTVEPAVKSLLSMVAVALKMREKVVHNSGPDVDIQ